VKGKKATLNDDTKEFIRQYLEEGYQKNVRIAAAQDAGIGEVGIFWIHEGFLIQSSIPYTEGKDYADFVNGSTDHCTSWYSAQRLRPKLRDYEYDQIPRGRVVFSRRDGKFHIYGSEEFVRNEEEKSMVLKAFSISADNAVFKSDEHYAIIECDLPEGFCDDFSGRD
jgi:hypothetical protein